MFEKFNNNFQNTVTAPNTNFNPYQDQYFGQNDKTPYAQGMNQLIPQPMAGNLTEQNLYPLESSLATPYLNTPVGAPYKHGGKVKRFRGGGFLKKPFKAIKSVLGGGAGAILGNMILPGVGGIIGGALGQGVQNTARGKNFLQGALKGAGMGAALPSVASGLGWGAGKLGANSLASSLTNYGNTNAILPALGLGGESSSSLMGGAKGAGLASLLTSGGGAKGQIPSGYAGLGVGAGSDTEEGGSKKDLGFMDKLLSKGSDYLSDPANLLTLGVVGSSFMNRPKKETPEKRARDEKAYQKGLMLTSDELQQKEAQDLALAQMRRRVDRNKFLPEERFAIDPLYVKSNTPEEYRKSNRWLNYYNNPDFSGEPLVMKKGGQAKTNGFFEVEEVEYPSQLANLIIGDSGGQDDDVRRNLRPGAYIMPADVVADAGDGNSLAGEKKIKALVSHGEMEISPENVSRLGNGDNDLGAKKLDMFVKNIRKHKRGGKVNLPPKAKGLASYMRGK